MIFPVQPSTGITESTAKDAVIGFVEHKPAFVVGEPNDQLLLLIDADQLLGRRS